MRKKLLLFLASGSVFLLFILFSFIVDKNVFKQLDFDTTVRLQDIIPRRLDKALSIFSDLGSFEVSTIILFVLVGVFIFRKQALAAFWIGVYGMFHILEIVGKSIVENSPPPEFMLRTERVVQFDQFHVRTDYSYPSGHSGRTVFFATILLFFLWHNKTTALWLKLCLTGAIITYVGVMLLSRVYLGEHWTTDVIGGSILGVSCGLLSIFFVSFRIPYRAIYNRLLSK